MATFTIEEILLDTIKALRHQLPLIMSMGRDTRYQHLKLDKEYIAHIAGIPEVREFDGNYQNGAQDARGLIREVPVVVDKHKHVPIKWAHIDSIKDQNQQAYADLVNNAAYAIALDMVLDILGKVNAANLTHKVTSPAAASDFAVVDQVRNGMNARAVPASRRAGIVNTQVASALGLDPQIGSAEYRGETGAVDQAVRSFRGVAGFQSIDELPVFPDNDENLTGVFFDPGALAIVQGIPEDFQQYAARALGAPMVSYTTSVTDPDTGFTLAAISENQQGTLDGFLNFVGVWGCAVGKQGGDPGDHTDDWGTRLVSA